MNRAASDIVVTIHMATSLDGFIARKNGETDWMKTKDNFPNGEDLDRTQIEIFLKSIDCYVMGSNTYLTALEFEKKGFGWSYGDKPVFVLSNRLITADRPTVKFYTGDINVLFKKLLRPFFKNIWIVGGGKVAGAALSANLVDELRFSLLPVVIGHGLTFFEKLSTDVSLHLMEVKAYSSGIVALRHKVLRK